MAAIALIFSRYPKFANQFMGSRRTPCGGGGKTDARRALATHGAGPILRQAQDDGGVKAMINAARIFGLRRVVGG